MSRDLIYEWVGETDGNERNKRKSQKRTGTPPSSKLALASSYARFKPSLSVIIVTSKEDTVAITGCEGKDMNSQCRKPPRYVSILLHKLVVV